MRIFVAGASGVLGIRIVPLLVGAGHTVAAMTRSPEKAATLRDLGADPIVCDVYDAGRLRDVVTSFRPDLIIDELTDLADDRTNIVPGANARIRREGTRNLVAAAGAAGGTRILSQSVAWPLQGDGQAAIEEHERLVIDAGGVVLRYGQLYGPGTYHERGMPAPPAIDIDEAARRTVASIDAPPGSILTLVTA